MTAIAGLSSLLQARPVSWHSSFRISILPVTSKVLQPTNEGKVLPTSEPTFPSAMHSYALAS